MWQQHFTASWLFRLLFVQHSLLELTKPHLDLAAFKGNFLGILPCTIIYC